MNRSVDCPANYDSSASGHFQTDPLKTHIQQPEIQMKPLKLLLTLACTAVLNGCAVFQLHDLPTATLPPAGPYTQRPSVGYDLLAQSTTMNTVDYQEPALEKMRGDFEQALLKTDYFSQVTSGKKDADIFLDVYLHESGSPAAMVGAFITGLSYFTIPSWATLHQEIRITPKDQDGAQTYIANDRARIVMWLPMILAFPFRNMSEATEMKENMYHTILQEMKNDGLLVK